jgi:tRNA pseudouridine32 synthase/23S rRNA pseudouridine746 synthase
MFKPKLKMPEEKGFFKENQPIQTLDQLKILYEDQYLVVVIKPAELQTVPGKTHLFSLKTLIQEKYPHATGSLIVHRLDQSTSGIVLIALDEKTHRYLSLAFENKLVKKRYQAVVLGACPQSKGEIQLPLRLDPFQRPTQVYDPIFGNEALTLFKCLHYDPILNHSYLLLYPHTGRTHQLRVHCAHHLGLGLPIIGDPFYASDLGRATSRLHLHANKIEFKHPLGKKLSFEDWADFEWFEQHPIHDQAILK